MDMEAGGHAPKTINDTKFKQTISDDFLHKVCLYKYCKKILLESNKAKKSKKKKINESEIIKKCKEFASTLDFKKDIKFVKFLLEKKEEIKKELEDNADLKTKYIKRTENILEKKVTDLNLYELILYKKNRALYCYNEALYKEFYDTTNSITQLQQHLKEKLKKIKQYNEKNINMYCFKLLLNFYDTHGMREFESKLFTYILSKNYFNKTEFCDLISCCSNLLNMNNIKNLENKSFQEIKVLSLNKLDDLIELNTKWRNELSEIKTNKALNIIENKKKKLEKKNAMYTEIKDAINKNINKKLKRKRLPPIKKLTIQ